MKKVTLTSEEIESLLKAMEENKLILPDAAQNDIEEIGDIYNRPPAVVFNNYNIYTEDRKINIDAGIYSLLHEINNGILQNVLSKKIDTINAKKFNIGTIANVMTSNIKMVADSFLLSISNIYNVFISKVNNLFIYEENGVYCTEYSVKPNYGVFAIEDFHESMDIYLNSSSSERIDIITNYVSEYAISFVNSVGLAIYNDTRDQLAGYFSRLKSDVSEESIKDFFNKVDIAFDYMMADMTYEAAAFRIRMQYMDRYILAEDTMPENLRY